MLSTTPNEPFNNQNKDLIDKVTANLETLSMLQLTSGLNTLDQLIEKLKDFQGLREAFLGTLSQSSASATATPVQATLAADNIKNIATHLDQIAKMDQGQGLRRVVGALSQQARDLLSPALRTSLGITGTVAQPAVSQPAAATTAPAAGTPVVNNNYYGGGYGGNNGFFDGYIMGSMNNGGMQQQQQQQQQTVVVENVDGTSTVVTQQQQQQQQQQGGSCPTCGCCSCNCCDTAATNCWSGVTDCVKGISNCLSTLFSCKLDCCSSCNSSPCNCDSSVCNSVGDILKCCAGCGDAICKCLDSLGSNNR